MQLFRGVGGKGLVLHHSCQAVEYDAGFQEQNAYLGSGELQALAGGGYEVSTSPDSQGTLALALALAPALALALAHGYAPCMVVCKYGCLQVCFRLFRHGNFLVLVLLTRSLTTKAHTT